MNTELDLLGERIIDAINTEIRNQFPVEDQETVDMAALVKSCVVVGLIDPYTYPPGVVIDWIAGCKTDYGSWLGCIRYAIAAADLSFLEEGADYSRFAMLGAFEAIRIWLLHLYLMRRDGLLPMTLH